MKRDFYRGWQARRNLASFQVRKRLIKRDMVDQNKLVYMARKRKGEQAGIDKMEQPFSGDGEGKILRMDKKNWVGIMSNVSAMEFSKQSSVPTKQETTVANR